MHLKNVFKVIVLIQTLAAYSGETRIEIPSEDAQKKSQDLVRDVFKAEYAKGTPNDRIALAKNLMKQAAETHDDASAKYVLIQEAIALAVQSGDAATAIQAVDSQAEVFKVDVITVLEKALEMVTVKVSSQDQRRVLTNGFLRIAEYGDEQNDYERATRAASKAESAARGAQDVPLLTRVQARAKEIKEHATEYQKVSASIEKLKNAPDDAEASTAVGRFHCFAKSNWEVGLPLLTKGSDPVLKSLAEKELVVLNSLADGTALVELGDGWWGLAEKQSGEAKQTVKVHAGQIYGRAIESLTGLNKARIQKRIDEINSSGAPAGKGRHELLPLMDVANAVKGTWKREGADIVSDKTQYGRLMIPCVLGNEYDVRYEFTCTGSKDVATLILHRDGKALAFEFGSYGKYAGFTLIDGRGLDANPTATEIPGFQIGKRYSVTVQVRRDKLVAVLDGKPLVETNIGNDRIALDQRWALPVKDRLGIGVYGAVIRFHSIQVSGQATLAK